MTHTIRTLAAVAWSEVLLNSRRVAPYALMIFFALNAALWWGWGPAVALGWATNSEYYIVRNLSAFSFLTGLPIFNAVIMADSVIKDFKINIDPLLFSKPITRAQYLFGKFAGSFITLVCCQSAFILTLIGLQFFRTSQMVVQPFKLWPYFKHFFFFLVISHLLLAAFYFTVGTLTRNAKIVYGLAVGFYPFYIAYQIFLLKTLPQSWRIFLDPILLNSGLKGNGFLHTADFLNHFVVVYTPAMLANRGLTILLAAVCLMILYLRFTTTERSKNVKHFSFLNLSTSAEGVYYPEEPFPELTAKAFQKPDREGEQSYASEPLFTRGLLLHRVNQGLRANVNKLIAALGIEFHLLRAERSLVVIMPLAVGLSILEVALYNIPPNVSRSAAYATNTANLMLLFLVGIAVFYIGEAMHRDREVRIEPVLWGTPTPSIVLLLSKFLATLLLLAGLMVLVGFAAVVIQFFLGHTPIDLLAYLRVYGIILLPGALFVTSISLALNVALRNKHVAYVISIGAAAGLFYLYNIGYNHWLYNPMMYGLWTYADFKDPVALQNIILHRAYVCVLAVGCVALARLFFPRR